MSFFRDLFIAPELRKQLEREIIYSLQIRSDYEKRLNEKDEIIAALRQQNNIIDNKLSSYELILIPALTQRKASLTNMDNYTLPESSWARVQREFYEAEAKTELINNQEENYNGNR